MHCWELPCLLPVPTSRQAPARAWLPVAALLACRSKSWHPATRTLQSFSAIVTACNFGSVPLAMVGIKVSSGDGRRATDPRQSGSTGHLPVRQRIQPRLRIPLASRICEALEPLSVCPADPTQPRPPRHATPPLASACSVLPPAGGAGHGAQPPGPAVRLHQPAAAAPAARSAARLYGAARHQRPGEWAARRAVLRCACLAGSEGHVAVCREPRGPACLDSCGALWCPADSKCSAGTSSCCKAIVGTLLSHSRLHCTNVCSTPAIFNPICCCPPLAAPRAATRSPAQPPLCCQMASAGSRHRPSPSAQPTRWWCGPRWAEGRLEGAAGARHAAEPSTLGLRPRLPMRQPCLPPTCRGGPLTFERPFHCPHPILGFPCMQQRQVGEAVLLEAALENATRDPMLLDTVTFLPSPGYTAERIGGGSSVAAEGSAGPLR